jgi:hypothetical protein
VGSLVATVGMVATVFCPNAFFLLVTFGIITREYTSKLDTSNQWLAI